LKRYLLALAPVPALAQAQDASSPAPASQPPADPPKKEAASSWTDKVKLSTKAYLRYSYELGEEARNANQFTIDRL
jgi:hypothetical protein